GAVRFRDKATLLRSYRDAGVEACELTLKRACKDYYACIAVRGLQPLARHPNVGAAVGLDMGGANPLASSDGCLVTEHQGHNNAEGVARLERAKVARQASARAQGARCGEALGRAYPFRRHQERHKN